MKNADMPAMPFAIPEDNGGWQEGLTKREHFAAMAMKGLLSSDVRDTPKNISYASVVMADALLAELERTK